MVAWFFFKVAIKKNLMGYSLTYTGVAVMILGWVFQTVGLPFNVGESETAIKFVVELAGALLALYGRYRAGGIKWFGAKV